MSRTCRWHLPRIRGWCTPSTCQGDVPRAKHIWVAHAKHTQTVHSTLRTRASLLAAGARLKRGGLKHVVHLHMPSARQAHMKVRAKRKPSARASPWAADLLASLDGLKHLPHLCAPCTHQAHAKHVPKYGRAEIIGKMPKEAGRNVEAKEGGEKEGKEG